MAIHPSHSNLRRACALLAALFGLVTVAAGGRILFGFGEAGFHVIRPVLIFNVMMGVAYIAAAFLMVRSLKWGVTASALILLANLIVLGALLAMRASGSGVANQTMAAMTLRSVLWAAIYLLLRKESLARVAGATG